MAYDASMRSVRVLLASLMAACGPRAAPPPPVEAPPRAAPPAAAPAAQAADDDDYLFALYTEYAEELHAAQRSAATDDDDEGDSRDPEVWDRLLYTQDPRLLRLDRLDSLRDECGVPVAAAHRAAALRAQHGNVSRELADLMGRPVGNALVERAREALNAVALAEREALEAREAVLRATIDQPCVVERLLEAQEWHDLGVSCAAEARERESDTPSGPSGDIDELDRCAETAADVAFSLHTLPADSESLREALAAGSGNRSFGPRWEPRRAAALDIAGRCGAQTIDVGILPMYR